MGDIRKIRKKYEKPKHPWNKARIELEGAYKKTYGLTNKKELWKGDTILKNFKTQIKSFPSMSPDLAKTQGEKLRARLLRLGLIKQDTDLGEVLGYETDVIFERRLQTIVFKKGLARSPKQARQFINHEHILVNGKVINSPGYLVNIDEEAGISFHTRSSLIDEEHPERVVESKKKKQKNTSDSGEEAPEVVELTKEDLDE